MAEKLRLYPCLEEVLAFGQYPEKVDALYKFDRGINKQNMFGDNVEYYKQVGLENGHNGIDICCRNGTKVLAPFNSWVLEEHDDEEDRNAGFGVVLVSDKSYNWLNGSTSHAKVVLWHNLKNLVEVAKEGKTEVETGQDIALADNTGFSTGPHVHFGLKQCSELGKTKNWDNGHRGAIDPYPYLDYWNLNMEHTCNENCKLNTDAKMDVLYEFGFSRKPDESGREFWKEQCVWTFLDRATKEKEHEKVTKILKIGNFVIQWVKKFK